MKARWMVLSLSAAMLVAVGGLQAAKEEGKDEAKEKKFAATCPVSGKPAGESHVVELKKGPYRGDKVYFCCDNCPKAFEKTPQKFELQVHRQLLETGQIKQVNCPLTGKPVNKEQKVEVGTTEVAFCCDKCKAKYEKASDEDKLKMLFSAKAMKNGFKSPKEASKDKKKKDAA